MSQGFLHLDDTDVQLVGSPLVGVTSRNGSPSCVLTLAAIDVLAYKRRFVATSNASGTVGALSIDAIDADPNRAAMDIVIYFAVDLMTATNGYIYVRGNAHTDWIRLNVDKATGISLEKSVASVVTTGIAPAAITFGAGKNFAIHLRANGTTVQARAWDLALGARRDARLGFAGEPTTWDINTTVTGVTAAGWAGWGTYHASTANTVFPVSVFSWGTNGDVAYCPLTEAEFDAWCDADVKVRNFIAELSALGYNPTGTPAYTKTIKAFIATQHYISSALDSPPNQAYAPILMAAPDFTVEMPSGSGGEGKVTFGDLVVMNPIEARPSTAPALEFRQTHAGGGGNNYTYRKISTPAYVIPAGARMRYEFFINPNNPAINLGAGGIEVDLTAAPNNGRSAAWLDTLGDSCVSLNSGGAHYVGGVWYSRDLPFVASMIGKTISAVDLVNEADTAGNYISHYRNIRITDAAGVTLLVIWNGGLPSANADAYTLSSSAISVEVVEAGRPSTSGATATDQTRGVRDRWADMKWNKFPAKIWMGDLSWKRVDYREYLVGCLGQPVASTEQTLVFKMGDTSIALDAPIQTSKFTTGAYAGQCKPLMLGGNGLLSYDGNDSQIEPPLTDEANLIYTISSDAIGGWYDTSTRYTKVFDRQNELRTANLTCIGVVGNVMQFSANHGMTVNYVWRSPSGGTLTGGLSYDTDYLIESVPANDKVTFKASRAGAVITLTNTTLVSSGTRGYGYEVVSTGPATIQLASGDPKQMRITVAKINAGGNASIVRDILASIASRAGLTANFIDTTTGNSGSDAYYWVGPTKTTARAVAEDFAQGTLSFFSGGRDGLFHSARVNLPTGAAVQSFNSHNIAPGSMRHLSTQRAVDFSKSERRVFPWFLTGGPFAAGTQAALQGYTLRTPVTYGTPAAPLDDYPAAGEAEANRIFTSYYRENSSAVTTFYALPIDRFEFQTKLRAFRRRLGDEVKITHPRHGFRTWSLTDPVSPDNPGDVDGQYAVIEKIQCRPHDAVPVTLTVFKQKRGYYPTANLN